MKFEDVDKLALKYFGYGPDDEKRLESVLKLLTKILDQNGTVYTDIDFMKKFCDKYRIIPKTLAQNMTYIKIKDEKYFTTNELHGSELYIENFCKELLKMGCIQIKKKKIKTDHQLHHRQTNAILSALLNRLSIISGGPGRGKTHIIKEIIAHTKNEDCHIMALSGAAVERIKADGIDTARTIHSFLYSLKKQQPSSISTLDAFDTAFESGSEVEATMQTNFKGQMINIIIDGLLVSMALFKRILQAIEPNISNIRLILVGDPNQLSSIGSGNLLYDMISSDIIPFTTLTKNFRTNIKSIIHNSKLARKSLPLEPDDDTLIYKKITSMDQIFPLMQDLISEYDLTPQTSCVLSPAATNGMTVGKLNEFLQELYNPDGHLICTNIKSEIRAGDRLMQTTNNKDDRVYNGSILSIDSYTYDDFIEKMV